MELVAKPRKFDLRGQATMTPSGKISLTIFGKIKMTPENDYCFKGFFVVLCYVLSDVLTQNLQFT